MNEKRPRFFFVTLYILIAIGVAGTFSLIYLLYQSDSPNETVVNLIIPRGATIKGVAQQLADENVIRHPRIFKYVLRFTGGTTRLRAGEFRFKKNGRMIDAIFVLYHDEPVVHQVTVPEGKTMRQIAEILAVEGLIDQSKFISLAHSQELLNRLKISAHSLEGYLFPDTYAFSLIDGEDRIIERMVQRFRQKISKGFETEIKNSGWTLERLLILASIIEKETGSGGERELVSSVFHNRLKRGMKLQSDPTTIYGMADYKGNLRRIDLLTPTPYNTYTIQGLPPGPICNPGYDAIIAALRPASTKYLYFVSNNNGSHIFAENLLEHNRNVDKYQRHLRKRKHQ